MQQAVERTFLVALGEKRLVAHFHGDSPGGEFVEPVGQLAQPLRAEAGRQLQPQRRNPVAQWRQQFEEVGGGGQLFAQVALVADIARQLGTEMEVRRHDVGPAAQGFRIRPGIEGGVAFHRVEHLGVVAEAVGRAQVGGIETAAPGRLVPRRATEVIRQHQA
ncbi:hypothetical protein D9M73_204540 [compost metagenome]